MTDFMNLLEEALAGRKEQRAATVLTAVAARRRCEAEGHQYQVHGKTNPTKVACKRCGVTWAIGPRTEPQ
jgi:hypothetical protein